jgi:sodium/potassium-transporting ATPase subunit beta
MMQKMLFQKAAYVKIPIIFSLSGVGFRPMPHDNDIESTLVWFRHGDDNGNWQPWVERLEKFLEVN